jgi:nicotinate-nucleotide pyrophosphorylase (carboxylating)
MNTDDLITRIIDLALEEDGEDVTSTSIFSPADRMRATFKAKAEGVLAGTGIAARVFQRLDSGVSCAFLKRDGERLKPGDTIGTVEGPAVVALNFLQRMSGIATRTAAYVAFTEGTKAKILDTRKTAPGQRVLDKEAVRAGGGVNHRMGLWDMALIKDNHIDREGSIEGAVGKVRRAAPGVPVEVEARTVEDVRKLLELGVDRIMLDNFTLEAMREAVELAAGRIPLEASGGISLATVRDVALTGVDFISVGDVTHSITALDISLVIEGIA